MASLVTHCSGDAPGTGMGVVSGTVGSVCYPKSHLESVRIRGAWAIRHNDEWWMNNRNSVGKLYYVRTTETPGPPPAITLAQNPEMEAQEPILLADASATGRWDFIPEKPSAGNRVARIPVLPGNFAAGLRAAGVIGLMASAGTALENRRATADATAMQSSAEALGLNLANPQEACLAWVHAFANHNFVSCTILSSLDNIPASGAGRDVALRAITEKAGTRPGSFERLLQGDRAAKTAYEQAVAMAIAAAAPALGPEEGNVRITRVLAATRGACVVLACPPPGDGFGGGAHACASQPPGDGKDSHHMPAESATAMPRAMGPAICMDVGDHARTPSFDGGALGLGYAM